MDYMIMIHSDEKADGPVPGTPEFDAMMGEWMAYNQQLIDGGHWIAAANLMPTETASLVRKQPGVAPAVSDGPYAETKEQLGGFYLISAADLDEAIALASLIPIPAASLEVRPVAFRPDAG
ncbi:MAG: YciI family protein [Acidimicrobiia bacterium]